MISVLLAATLAAAPMSDTALAPADQLPAEWAMGDFGTPINWNGHTLYVYADIASGDGMFARNAVAVDGELMIQPLNDPTGDSFYWITDGVEQDDGSLLVAALEVVNLPDAPNDGWAFEIVDTDMFVVRNPLDPESWRFASSLNRIDEGWWDGKFVEFSDQHDGLAFTVDSECGSWTGCRGDVVEYDVETLVGSAVAETPRSSGVFAPVQTATGWLGVSSDFLGNTATYWTTDNLSGEWVEGETVVYADGQTHAHGVNVIDSEVVHRWSTLRQRPSYEVIG